MENNNLYEKFKEEEVYASSVTDFLNKFMKKELLPRFSNSGNNKKLIESYEDDFKTKGYCFIVPEASVTGKLVSYFGNSGY